MKALFEEKPCPDVVSNYTSSSSQSKDDQEMGSSTAMSKGGDVLSSSWFLCFQRGIDSNFGRGVR